MVSFVTSPVNLKKWKEGMREAANDKNIKFNKRRVCNTWTNLGISAFHLSLCILHHFPRKPEGRWENPRVSKRKYESLRQMGDSNRNGARIESHALNIKMFL
jgi:hypothetical protein